MQKCSDGEDWWTQRNIDYVLQLDAERVDREERYGGRLGKHRDAWGDLSDSEAHMRRPTPPPPVISSHTQSSPNQEKARGGESVTARDSDQSVNKDAAEEASKGGQEVTNERAKAIFKAMEDGEFGQPVRQQLCG